MTTHRENIYLGIPIIENWLEVQKERKPKRKAGDNYMDWGKVLMHGLRGFLFALIAVLLAVVAGALTAALGYKPEGVLNIALWQYIVYPAIVGLIAAVENWRKHLGDPKK